MDVITVHFVRTDTAAAAEGVRHEALMVRTSQ